MNSSHHNYHSHQSHLKIPNILRNKQWLLPSKQQIGEDQSLRQDNFQTAQDHLDRLNKCVNIIKQQVKYILQDQEGNQLQSSLPFINAQKDKIKQLKERNKKYEKQINMLRIHCQRMKRLEQERKQTNNILQNQNKLLRQQLQKEKRGRRKYQQESITLNKQKIINESRIIRKPKKCYTQNAIQQEQAEDQFIFRDPTQESESVYERKALKNFNLSQLPQSVKSNNELINKIDSIRIKTERLMACEQNQNQEKSYRKTFDSSYTGPRGSLFVRKPPIIRENQKQKKFKRMI